MNVPELFPPYNGVRHITKSGSGAKSGSYQDQDTIKGCNAAKTVRDLSLLMLLLGVPFHLFPSFNGSKSNAVSLHSACLVSPALIRSRCWTFLPSEGLASSSSPTCCLFGGLRQTGDRVKERDRCKCLSVIEPVFTPVFFLYSELRCFKSTLVAWGRLPFHAFGQFS